MDVVHFAEPLGDIFVLRAKVFAFDELAGFVPPFPDAVFVPQMVLAFGFVDAIVVPPVPVAV